MVHIVQIVVEKQQSENRRRLDDDRAPSGNLMRLMFGKSAEVEQSETKIRSDHIEPQGNPADA
ncbi:hypothetical protein D3C83_288440 [compost metagenome]